MLNTERIDEILDRARRLARQDREAFIRDGCGLSDSDADELVRLLDSTDSIPDEFLSTLPPGAIASDQPSISLQGFVGASFQGLTLEVPLGSGGFGAVFLAREEAPVSRRVAVKLLKGELPADNGATRFDIECAALARLNHDGIARVYRGGKTPAHLGSLRFIAMEYVDGVSVTDFAKEQKPDVQTLVRLVIEICEAVQHAHGRGVIHRDLKPSNILVTTAEHDGTERPRVKVIDFGIALPIDRIGTSRLTAEGHHVGTPLYMSPEQLGVVDADIDIRSDVFAIGIVLYELVTGTTPFGESGDQPRLASIIARQFDNSPTRKPSDTIRRRIRNKSWIPPGVGAKQLVRELDWIILKACDRDPSRRYATAQALADDLRRYLERRPVAAKSVSARYTVTKAIERNKTPALAVAIVTVLLPGLAAWGLLSATQAREAQLAAERQSMLASAALDFVTDDLLSAADVSRGGRYNITVIETLESATSLVPTRFGSEPLIRAEVEVALAQVYSSLFRHEEAVALFEAAAARRLRHLGPRHRSTLVAQTMLADALTDTEYQRRSLQLARENAVALLRVEGEDDADTLRARSVLGKALLVNDRVAESIDLLTDVYAAQRKHVDAADPETLRTAERLATALKSNSEYNAALSVLSDALDEAAAKFGDQHPRVLDLLQSLAQIQGHLGLQKEREQTLLAIIRGREGLLGNDHPMTEVARLMLGQTYYNTNRAEEAEPLLRRAALRLDASLGHRHRHTLMAYSAYAKCLVRLGRYAEALPILERSLDDHVELLGRSDGNTHIARLLLGTTYLQVGESSAAELLFRRSVAQAQSHFGEQHHLTASAYLNHARSLSRLGRHPEAASRLAQAESSAIAIGFDPSHPLRMAIQGLREVTPSSSANGNLPR